MAAMERMTITLTDDQADSIKAAVASGDYASQSEVIREALRDWALNQSFRKQALVEPGPRLRRRKHHRTRKTSISRAQLPLRIADAAAADLAEIWAFIAEDSPTAADTFVREIVAKFEPLRQFPEMGAAREQLAEGLRAIPYRDYVIYYFDESDALVIARVLHGARDARVIFGA
jgi:toxin ParE1/3/4